MRGESGRSLDSGERGLERLLDAAMRRRIRDDSVTLADVLTLARQLHDYRDGNSRPAHLDDRVGVLDDNERVIAELLVSEGRNVTHVVRRKSGEPTPDLVVDGEFAEVKTSIGAGVEGFRRRLHGAQASRVFVNARRSLIDPDAMDDLVSGLIGDACLTYARVIGEGYDTTYGEW